jgi:hypothetical protein
MLLRDTSCCLPNCAALICYLVTEVSEKPAVSRGRKVEAACSQTLAPTEGTTRYPPQKTAQFIIIPVTTAVLTIWVKAVLACWRFSSCHGCGDQLPACHRCVPGRSQVSVCTSCVAKWHWDRFFPRRFDFPPSLSFHLCSTIIFH